MRNSYDTDSALMVEEVLREMFCPYRPERRVLQAYFAEGMTQEEIGVEIGVHKSNVCRHYIPMSERIFGEQWARLIRGGK